MVTIQRYSYHTTAHCIIYYIHITYNLTNRVSVKKLSSIFSTVTVRAISQLFKIDLNSRIVNISDNFRSVCKLFQEEGAAFFFGQVPSLILGPTFLKHCVSVGHVFFNFYTCMYWDCLGVFCLTGEPLILHCDAVTNSKAGVTLIYWLVNGSFPEDISSSGRIEESAQWVLWLLYQHLNGNYHITAALCPFK